MSGLNRIFTGEIPIEFYFSWGNSLVNFMGQNPGGENFLTFPSGGYAHALYSCQTCGARVKIYNFPRQQGSHQGQHLVVLTCPNLDALPPTWSNWAWSGDTIHVIRWREPRDHRRRGPRDHRRSALVLHPSCHVMERVTG